MEYIAIIKQAYKNTLTTLTEVKEGVNFVIRMEASSSVASINHSHDDFKLLSSNKLVLGGGLVIIPSFTKYPPHPT